MDRDIIMEALSLGRCCDKVTRIDVTTGIFACPKLLCLSDGEEENLHVNAQNGNLPNALDVGPAAQLFHSLEQIDPEFHQSTADQVRRVMALSDAGNPLLNDEDLDLPERLSNMEWIEYLVKKGPTILTATPENKVQTCKILRKLGSEIMVLPPGNNADNIGDWRDKSQWRRQLSALASELMMVEDGCSSEVRDLGVFVLTTFQYPALLELVAQEMLTGDWQCHILSCQMNLRGPSGFSLSSVSD